MPLTAALVLSTLGVQLACDNGVLFYAARMLFCATYVVQSVPLLFFSYGTGREDVASFGPYEAFGGHCIPLEVRRDSLDVCKTVAAFKGDLFALGLATPRSVIELRERGIPEDRVSSIVRLRPRMAGTHARAFWYRVGMLLRFLE